MWAIKIDGDKCAREDKKRKSKAEGDGQHDLIKQRKDYRLIGNTANHAEVWKDADDNDQIKL